MQQETQLSKLQQEWERVTERATKDVARVQELGEMLTEGAGLHVKSGVEAGGLWGTTSCTCLATCGPLNCR